MEQENTQNIESSEPEINSLADIKALSDSYASDSSQKTEVQESDDQVEVKADEATATGEATEELEAQAKVEEPAQAYTPDFSYKTPAGKKEFPEALRSIIKTKEDEQYWRDTLSAAEGLPKIKEEGLKWQKNYEDSAGPASLFITNAEAGRLAQAFEAAGVQKPTVQQIVSGFGYSPEVIGREVMRLMDLTPEQSALESRAYEVQQREQLLEQQRAQIEESQRQAQTAQLSQSIESVLSQDTIVPLVAEFDRRNGPNAFKLEIAEHGERVFQNHGVILSPEQLAQHVIKRYGLDALVKQEAARNATAGNQVAHRQTPKAQTLPTIPAIGEGSTGSPAEQSSNNLNDLKRYYQNQYGQV